jgi:energy-converting hydrogenase Eha subunit E
MTGTTSDPAAGPPAPDRQAAFATAVSERKLRADGAGKDKVARILGIVLMVAGVVGTFLAYNNSLAQDDLRDIASSQILAVGFVSVTVVGSGLYVVGAVARVLRLWLLRQLVESQDRSDQIAEALRSR